MPLPAPTAALPVESGRGLACPTPGGAGPLPPAAADALAVLDDPVELRRFTRTTTDSEGREQAESALRISGMHCAACAGTIEQALAAVDGVVHSSVSASGERALVQWLPARTRMATIVAAIQRAGYDAAPDAALEARQARRLEARAALWRLFVAGFCAMQVMMMATPSYVTTGDDLAPDLRQLLNWGSWLLTLPVLAFSAGPFFSGAWRSLRQRRIGMDVPVALGIAVTFITSTGATFDPGGVFGHEVYFDSLTMFVSFLLAGRLFETRARHKVAQVLESALQGMPETAQRLQDGGVAETVSVQRLRVGDRVRVPVGQAFPADGVVQQGETRADEALLTGESAPVAKPCGAAVVAGSLNVGAPVVVLLTQVGEATRLAGIVALMQQAMTQRPAWARAADRWAAPFLWVVLLLAAGSAAVWSVVEPARAVWVGVAVLIVTCPCALSLAAPSAMLAAASALARRGVIWQRLDALEALTKVQRVYLDKTGTVTDEHLALTGVHRVVPPSNSLAAPQAARLIDADLLLQAASLAAWSSHPLSQAVVASAAAVSATAPALQTARADQEWHHVQEIAGQGVLALDAQGLEWRLGSFDFVGAAAAHPADGAGRRDGSAPVPVAAGAADAPDAAAPEVWLGCAGHALARLQFDEALRPDAVAAVAALRAAGLSVWLLSGDHPARAQRMGDRLQVDGVIGGATPERKLAEVVAAQASGLVVAMVGDGLNDAPVLARADVALAMGQGALVARAPADAVVASSRLMDLVHARSVALRTLRVVRQNMGWSVAYNLTCIPLAMAGWLPPWAAGLGMAASSLLVVANAARLAR